jgi:GntR family transcriptional regulator
MTSVRRFRADRAHQVANVIRQQVVQGAFDRVLPNEPALMAEFGMSRNTIRAALDALRREGLVERVPGTGTVVAARKYSHELDQPLGLAEILHEHGTVTNQVRMAEHIKPPRTVAERLQRESAEGVVYIERLRWLNDLPLALDMTYLTMGIGKPLLAEDLTHQDLYALIEQTSGQRPSVADLHLEAVNADAHLATVLDVPRRAALLVIERLSQFDDHRPVGLEFIRLRGDRFSMHAQSRRRT